MGCIIIFTLLLPLAVAKTFIPPTTMVFTGAQQTAFYQEVAQMGLSHRTRIHLQGEGIDHPEDLAEFIKKETWDQIVENCKRPPQIPDPAGGGGLINQQSFQLPARSLMRLKVAAKVALYYRNTARAMTAANMTWVRLNNFQLEMESLLDRKKANDDLTMPIISKTLSITAFFEAYDTYAGEFIGQADCPITWIYRDSVAVAGAVPALDTDQPYSEQHGSVAEEMVHRLSHTHPYFRVDNATGYAQLVTATLGTQYAATISPFKRTRNGRAALNALKAQFAGPAFWDKEVKLMNDFLTGSKWTGTTPFTLHGFLAKHRASFNTLQRCAEHVATELPNERTRVGYLLENIECNDLGVKTALSHIRLDDGATGMRSSFERAVAFLLPTDPVRKRKVKRGAAQISAVGAGNPKAGDGKGDGRSVRFKPTTGKTGVEFRYYKASEFNKLTQEQRTELINHRKENGNYKGAFKSKSKGGNGDKGQLAKGLSKAAVNALIKERETQREKEEEESKAKRTGLIEALRGIIQAEVAAGLGRAGSAASAGAKRLRAASSIASVADAGLERAAVQDEASERHVQSLLDKFQSMGTKARGKSG